MASSKAQNAQARRNDEPQVLSDGLRDCIKRVASEPREAAQPLPTTVQVRHIEQMYELANIFASIFDALHDAPDDAIATTREAT